MVVLNSLINSCDFFVHRRIYYYNFELFLFEVKTTPVNIGIGMVHLWIILYMNYTKS